MSVTRDLLDGLAQGIAAAGLGTFSTTGAYTAGQTGIVFSTMPPDPDRVIVLTAYRVGGDDPAHPRSQVTVQIRTRGIPDDPRDVDTLDDRVHDAIQGLTDQAYGGVHVIQAVLKSSMPMGQDSNNRWERSSNYTFDCDVPATSNRSY